MKAQKMTPTDFVPHVTSAVADLAKGQPLVAVPMAEVYEATCERMKIKVEDYGDSNHGKPGKKTPWVHRQIQLAFRQMRDKGLGEYAGRGQWALTQEGIDSLSGDTPEAPAPVAVAAKVQATRDDADDTNVVHLPVVEEHHPYSDDPYIRGLAVERTSCFGAYSVRSDVCKDCALQKDCIAAIAARKAEIAADLEREELSAKKAAEAQAKKKAQQNASIDELMASMDGENNDAVGKKGKYKPLPDQVVSDAFAQRESVCTQCDQPIAEQAPCYWVEQEGIFHPECIEVDGS